MRRRYTNEQLANAVRDCLSIRSVLSRIGLRPAGGNYQVIKKRIRELDLDTSHFLGQAVLRGRTHSFRTRRLEDVLVHRKVENTWRLRNRLLSERMKQPLCEQCGNSEWLGHPIPLELHHKDGDASNNTMANIQLLCPNCHALTVNYRGKKKRRCRDCTAETYSARHGQETVQTPNSAGVCAGTGGESRSG